MSNSTKSPKSPISKNITGKNYSETKIFDISKRDINDLMKKYDTSIEGLPKHQVEKNRNTYGKNIVTQHKEKTLIQRIFEAFINPFTLILIFLATVSIITDIVMPLAAEEETDVLTVIIILTMVIISGTLRFIQESKSGNAAAKLIKMITTTATVDRGVEKSIEVPIEDLVVGDIIHFSAGDMIPADIRIIEAKDLFISQSALTGESDPLEKFGTPDKDQGDTVTDCRNIVFMGSNVISGTAIGIIVSTGDNTLFGALAKEIAKEPSVTSFEKGVNAVSWLLIRFMLVMVPVVFLINGITKGDWTEALLFGISIAVGLTPEMLPMIVTTCLAKGAISMSKEKTIVKNLNSIQNLGAIDILCSDKTGTLTQDQVILEYHLDVHGKEDPRVLRHAFLNSFFQTGLKNLIDLAIIRRTDEESVEFSNLRDLRQRYKKIDEIPFDFTRRRMSVVVEDLKGKTKMITKGAVEEMLSICSHAEYNGKVMELDKKMKENIIETVDKLNEDGMRVIAIAQKANPKAAGLFHVEDESDMTLIGYLAFLDPPKETAAAAIKALLNIGVQTKILTGDNEKVTRCICKQVGLKFDHILLGNEVEKMNDKELSIQVEKTNIFAKLSPSQKTRVIKTLRENGHTVGFLGDGINDAAAMKESDVGISVDTAVDIAKESADIILLEKNLMVLEKGIVEGRKTYANMIKYIKMTASSNFGNMFSVLAASALIPFLPMMSVHLILLNLIYDLSCTAIPWDNVDEEFLVKPKKWDASSVGSFMIWIGPTSSIFDFTTYLIMYFIICPQFVSDGVLYNAIPDGTLIPTGAFAGMDTKETYVAMFQAGWFVESMWSQTLVIHMIRTPKIPFIQSRASMSLTLLTFTGIILLTIIPFTAFGRAIGFVALPNIYFLWLAITIFLYMALATNLKKAYVKYYKELL